MQFPPHETIIANLNLALTRRLLFPTPQAMADFFGYPAMVNNKLYAIDETTARRLACMADCLTRDLAPEYDSFSTLADFYADTLDHFYLPNRLALLALQTSMSALCAFANMAHERDETLINAFPLANVDRSRALRLYRLYDKASREYDIDLEMALMFAVGLMPASTQAANSPAQADRQAMLHRTIEFCKAFYQSNKLNPMYTDHMDPAYIDCKNKTLGIDSNVLGNLSLLHLVNMAVENYYNFMSAEEVVETNHRLIDKHMRCLDIEGIWRDKDEEYTDQCWKIEYMPSASFYAFTRYKKGADRHGSFSQYLLQPLNLPDYGLVGRLLHPEHQYDLLTSKANRSNLESIMSLAIQADRNGRIESMKFSRTELSDTTADWERTFLGHTFVRATPREEKAYRHMLENAEFENELPKEHQMQLSAPPISLTRDGLYVELPDAMLHLPAFEDDYEFPALLDLRPSDNIIFAVSADGRRYLSIDSLDLCIDIDSPPANVRVRLKRQGM